MRSISATARQRASSFLLLAVLAFSTALARAADAAIAVTVNRSGEVFHVAATIHTTAPLPTVWEVMTDFEHMTTILNNLKTSTVLKRDGHNLVVRQEGVARYGILSFSFESEREVNMEPPRRIFTRQISGTAKKMESEVVFEPVADGVTMRYIADIQDDSIMGNLFGTAFLKHEIEEQFQLMVVEMERRAKR